MRRRNGSMLCAALVLLPLALSAKVWGQSSSFDAPANDHPEQPQQLASVELPDSPGAVAAQSENQAAPGGSNPQTQSSSGSQTAPPPDTAAQKPERPVGTAAAEAAPVSGITAAQPAGVAVAPAKQHRVRTLVLRVGAIVGAGAALGAVVALSEGTSSKPPGAH
jgi:hypothetical protein